MTIAITRGVSPSIAQCVLSHIERSPIDLDLAVQQHSAYVRALQELGCKVIELENEPELPDSVFVEDTAIVLDEIAVITRPGAPSRRAETSSIAEALRPYRSLLSITEPATLDGGDVLRIGRKIYVGLSARTSQAAVSQLRDLVTPHGYRVIGVPIQHCLHLKSAVTEVAAGVVLIQPQWVDAAAFAEYEIILVDPDELHAANALRVDQELIYPEGFARTEARLHRFGIKPTLVAVSELQKAEGAVTCCSLILA